MHRLDQISFVWDPLTEDWEAHFAALEKFKQREGHCSALRNHVENGLRLGNWIFHMRVNRLKFDADLIAPKKRAEKSKLTVDQIKRLNSLGFVWKA